MSSRSHSSISSKEQTRAHTERRPISIDDFIIPPNIETLEDDFDDDGQSESSRMRLISAHRVQLQKCMKNTPPRPGNAGICDTTIPQEMIDSRMKRATADKTKGNEKYSKKAFDQAIREYSQVRYAQCVRGME